MEALTILEKEKNISKDVMMDAIENSLISACKNHFGTAENIKVIMDRETCDYAVYAEKKVVEEVTIRRWRSAWRRQRRSTPHFRPEILPRFRCSQKSSDVSLRRMQRT